MVSKTTLAEKFYFNTNMYIYYEYTWVIKILMILDMVPTLIFLDGYLFTNESTNYLSRLLSFMDPLYTFRFYYSSDSFPKLNSLCNYDKVAGDFYRDIVQYLGILITANILIILFNKKWRVAQFIVVNISNTLSRYEANFPLGQMNFLFIYQMDKNIIYGLLFFILGILFLVYILIYIDQMFSLKENYPYDIESKNLDKFSIVIKYLASLVTFYKLSEVCGTSPQIILLKNFLSKLIIIIIIMQLLYVYFYRKKLFLINSEYNEFRISLIIIINIFLVMKIVESYLRLYDITMNFIMLITTAIFTTFLLFFFNKKLMNFSFMDSNYNIIECIYLANKFISIITNDTRTKDYKEFEIEFSDKIDIHKLSSYCSSNKQTKCFICSNLPSDYSNSEIKSSIRKFFLNIINERGTKSEFYYSILRIRSFLICFYSYNSHENLLLLELYQNKLNSKTHIQSLQYKYLYRDFFKLKSKIKKRSSSSLINSLNWDNVLLYYDICQQLDKICKNVKETLVMLNNKIQFNRMISISKRIYKSKTKIKNKIIFITENFNLYMIYFNYRFIFNKDLNKTFKLDDNLEILNVIEENYEKMNHIILECQPRDYRLTIKTVTLDFLKEIKCEKSYLKNESLSKIFPPYLSQKQNREIFDTLQKENKDMFSIDLMILDNENNLKYFTFNMRPIIDMNLRIFILIKYKNLSSSSSSKKSNLILMGNGKILAMSEQCKKLFVSLDKKSEMKLNVLIKQPFQKLFKLEENMNKGSRKNSMKFQINEIFEKEFLRTNANSKETEIDYNGTIKIFLEEVIYNGTQKYYVFSFKKYIKNMTNNTENKKKIEVGKSKVNENSSGSIMTLNNSLNSDLSASNMRKRKTSDSQTSTNYFKENTALVIQNNMKLFNQIQKKNAFRKNEILIYVLNFILSVIGIFFIIFLNMMLDKYQKAFSGLFRFRALRSHFAAQVVKSTFELRLNNDDIRFEEGCLLNSEKFRRDLSECQIDEIRFDLDKLKEFINQQNDDDYLKQRMNEVINYVEISAIQNKLLIKSKQVLELLDNLYLQLFNLKDKTNIYFDPTYLYDFDNLPSYMLHYSFLIQNYFPVFERFFSNVHSTLKNIILLSIHDVRTNVLVYQMFFIFSHLLVLILVAYLLKKYYLKFRIMLNLISEFDEGHLKNLNSKYNLLDKSIEYLITPTKFIKSIQNNYLKNKTDLIERKRQINQEETLPPLQKELKIQINEFSTNSHAYPFWGVFFTYIIFFSISIILYNIIINDINNTAVFTNELAEIQFKVYSSFILYRIATLSGLNVTNILNSELEFYKPVDYLNYNQNLTIQMLESYKNIYNLKYSTGIKRYSDIFITNLTGSYVCDFSLDQNSALFLLQNDSNKLFNYELTRCRNDTVNEGHIYYVTFPKITRNLIYYLNSLIQNNTLENRLDILNDEFSFHYSENFLLVYAQFFSKLYSGIIEPMVTNGFQTFFFQFILMFTISIIVDIACALLIKYLILSKVGYYNKTFLILFKIYKN